MSGKLEKTNEHRVSIHVSPNSKGHLVNGHISTEDTGHRNAAAYFELNPAHPTWLLSCQSPGALEESSVFKRKSSDTVRQISVIDSRIVTLVYLIWISRIDLPKIASPWPQQVEGFSYFRISRMTHRLCVPSSGQGYSNFFATPPRRTNNIPDDRQFWTNYKGTLSS